MGRRDVDAHALSVPAPLDGRPPPPGGRRPSASRALLLALLAVLLVVVALRLLGIEGGTTLVLLVGALPLVLLPAYPLVVAGLVLRSPLITLGAVVVVAAHVALVAPAVTATPIPAAAEGAPVLRVVVANLYRENPDPRRAAERLRELDADVLVVPELDPRGRRALEDAGLTDDLPFSVDAVGAGDELVGLLSRLPVTDLVLRRAGGRISPQITVDVDGTPVRVLAVHPLPPIGALQPLWRTALADAAASVRATELPVVVAGDLNADRDHGPFRALLDTGLRDVHDELGRGLARTWPARLPLLHLDHVLVRDGAGARLVPLRVREVEVLGSDHLGVVTDVAVVRSRATSPG